MENGNYDDFQKIHNISEGKFTFMLKKEEKEVKVKIEKPVTINVAKEKAKLEKELEKLLNEQDALSEKMNDPEKEYNWIEFKEMQDQSDALDEKIEEIMSKLEKLDA